MFIDKVSNCKYLGHCINDKLNDDDDMARQRKQIICPGKCIDQKVLYVFGNSQNIPVQVILLLAVHQCGVIIAVNLYENYLLRTTMFLEK